MIFYGDSKRIIYKTELFIIKKIHMNRIKINPRITGVAGNASEAPLEVCIDFHPIVHVSLSIQNSDYILDNVIRIHFDGDDQNNESFIEEMKYPQLEGKPQYFVPYIRMWPSAQEDRIIILNCMPATGHNNCALSGDIYFEIQNLPDGLTILADETEDSRMEMTSLAGGVIKDQPIKESFVLNIQLLKGVDRKLTSIKEVPLVFYVLNEGERMEVGRVHLSVAPKDVFSKFEIDKYLDKFKEIQDRIEDSQNYCLPAFREALEALLYVKADDTNERNKQYKRLFNARTKNYENYVMHTYCNALSDQGIAQHFFTTSYNLNPAKTLFKQSGRTYEETFLPTTMVSPVSEKCMSEVKEQVGYHLFGVSLIYGSHVMSLVADHSKLNNIEFILSDYHLNGTNTYSPVYIDEVLDKHSIGAWKYYFANVGRGINKPNSKFDLWKIQNF